MARYLYSELSGLIQARINCQKNDNLEWRKKHEDRIEFLVREHMPHGSGFDSGTTIDLSLSHADKLVFPSTAYHHMNDGGYYDGWTVHTVTVTPSFTGFHLRVSGTNRNDIKEYIGESFQIALMTDLTDQIEFERLSPKYGIVYRPHWRTDQCSQRWDVIYQETETERAKSLPNGSDFNNWIDARHFAVGYMLEVENIMTLAADVAKLTEGK